MIKSRPYVLLLAAKIGLSAVLLWLVLRQIEVGDILGRLRSADLRWVLPALLVGPVAVLLLAWRWCMLSLGLIRFGDAVKYTWIGLFFGSILPGMVGGDVAKGVSLAARDQGTRDSRLPMSIAMDKLVGLWALLFMFGCVALPLLSVRPELLGNARRAVWVALALTGAGLAGGAALCHPQGARWLSALAARTPSALLRRVAEKVAAAVGSYGGQGRILLSAVLISLCFHALNALCLWMVLRSLAVPATPAFAAIFYPLLSGLLALPVSISGVGVRDLFAVGMFTTFGFDPGAAVAFSWLLLALSLPNALIGGAVQLFELFRSPRAD